MLEEAPRKQRRWLVDKLMMLGGALLFIFLGDSAFLLADIYHINPSWVFMAGVSLSVLPILGWDYRSQFRSVPFIVFLLAWMLLHGLTFVFVMANFGWMGWLAALLPEFILFYLTAYWLFGLEPPSNDDSNDENN